MSKPNPKLLLATYNACVDLVDKLDDCGDVELERVADTLQKVCDRLDQIEDLRDGPFEVEEVEEVEEEEED